MRTAFVLGAAAGWALLGAWALGCAAGGSASTQGTGASGGAGAGTGAATSSSSSSTTSSSSTSASSSTTGSGGGGSSSTSTSSSGGAGGAGGMPNPGLPLGANCNVDTDCASMLCMPVVIDSNPVCVTPCTQQSDCGASGPGASYFCEPVTAGSSMGYCIPHSPAHCLSCKQDSDCGSLSEVCFQAPGDDALSCNIDCSIAGASACPPDYTCTDETVNGQSRQLCRPNLISTCLQAVGGYCDRLSVPQPCIDTNTAGQCIGQRTCMTSNQRFSACDAQAPQCLTDCSMQAPAGCTESYCSGATSAPTNCGTCGNVCPGYMAHDAIVTCNTSQMCTFACMGANYDVNDNPADGCEVAASPQGNNAQANALNEGTVTACDGGDDKQFTFSGHLPSDKRVHEDPAVTGFDTTTGAAPEWFYLVPDSSPFCSDDLVMQLCVTGSSDAGCYELTAISGSSTTMYSCQVDKTTGCCPADPSPQGSCADATNNISFMGICKNQGNQWSGSTPAIYIEVQKTCSTATAIEDPSFTVYGHL